LFFFRKIEILRNPQKPIFRVKLLLSVLSKFKIIFQQCKNNCSNFNNKMTFRDLDVSPYRSVHTGTGAKPFNGWWMDVDERGCATTENESGVDLNEDCGFPDVAEPYIFQRRRNNWRKINTTCSSGLGVMMNDGAPSPPQCLPHPHDEGW